MSSPALRTLTGIVMTLGFVAVSHAQSGTRVPTQQPIQQTFQQPVPQAFQQGSATKAPMQGSATKAPMQGSATKGAVMQNTAQGSATKGSGTRQAASLGLQGYCPVCVIEMKQWMKGDPNIQASYDGKTYYFPGEKQRQTFLANPAKYVPALGGDCSVCLVNMNKRAPGSIHFSALNNGRLYLFPGEKQKQMFVDDPGKYNKVDIAMNGQCVVCKVEMNKQVPGSPEVATMHNGMKYQFMSDEQRKMFTMNPGKYTSGAAAGSMSK